MTRYTADLISYVITSSIKYPTNYFACAIGQVYKIYYNKLTTVSRKEIQTSLSDAIANYISNNNYFLDKKLVTLSLVDWDTHEYIANDTALTNLSNEDLCLYANKYGIDFLESIKNGVQDQKFKFIYKSDENERVAELYEYDESNGWLLCANDKEVGFTSIVSYNSSEETLLNDFSNFIKSTEQYIGELFDYTVEFNNIGNYDITSEDTLVVESPEDDWSISLSREYFNYNDDEEYYASDPIKANITYNSIENINGASLSIEDSDVEITLDKDLKYNNSIVVTYDGTKCTAGTEIKLLKVMTLEDDIVPMHICLNFNLDSDGIEYIWKNFQSVEKTNVEVTIKYNDNKSTFVKYIDVLHN